MDLAQFVAERKLQLQELEELRLDAYESSRIYKEKLRLSMIGEFYTQKFFYQEKIPSV